MGSRTDDESQEPAWLAQAKVRARRDESQRGMLDTIFAGHPDNPFDQPCLRCPVCGHNYIHPGMVETNAGGSITCVTNGGTTMRQGAAVGRGVLIELCFTCENDHAFAVELHFHKGATLLRVRVLDAAADMHATIWRD